MFANCMTQFSLHIYPNMTKCSDGERSLHNQPFPRNVEKKFKSEKAMLLKLNQSILCAGSPLYVTSTLTV